MTFAKMARTLEILVSSGSVVVETFARPQYLLKFWNCQVHKNSNYEAIESHDLNIENW